MRISEFIEKQGYRTVGIWGMGRVGKAFVDHLPAKRGFNVRLYDKGLEGQGHGPYAIEGISAGTLRGVDLLVITPVDNGPMLRQAASQELGFGGDVKTLEGIINEL